MRFSTSFEPLCAGTCRYGEHFGRSRTACSKSSVMSLGKLVTNFSRASPEISCSRYSKSDNRVVRFSSTVPITVHGLAQQRDFAAAFVGQLSGFGDNVIRMPALLRSAHLRHDAIGAKFIAADLNAHKRLIRRRAHGGIAVGIVAFEAAFNFLAAAGFAIEAHFQPRLRLAGNSFGGDFFQQPRHLVQLPGADDQIDKRRSLENQPLIFLRHAAQHADDFLRVDAALACLSRPSAL